MAIYMVIYTATLCPPVIPKKPSQKLREGSPVFTGCLTRNDFTAAAPGRRKGRGRSPRGFYCGGWRSLTLFGAVGLEGRRVGGGGKSSFGCGRKPNIGDSMMSSKLTFQVAIKMISAIGITHFAFQNAFPFIVSGGDKSVPY